MEEIVGLARTLGKRIAGHARFKALRVAEARAAKDPEAMKTEEAFRRQAQKILELERQTKPVEVADKRELERLQQAMRTNGALQELAKAQADYLEMMNQVNECILAELRGHNT